ncbi:MAG: DUF1816 domain-containing protein [Tildeniella nuda ZEHNDER 1965/U140]|nr:DUF1816 domain-containing protein [Tildeniella nuda ZEHNDER 1965/U140]
MQDLLLNLLNLFGFAWWVEVITDTPTCTYYFGPFLSAKAATAAKSGYVEDLEQEGAQGIKVTLKRFKPSRLTVADDLGEKPSQGAARSLRGQLQ